MPNRSSMFVAPPPKGMENPVGRWYCEACGDYGWSCKDGDEHVWHVKWVENEKHGE